jgi:hypothetical protein
MINLNSFTHDSHMMRFDSPVKSNASKHRRGDSAIHDHYEKFYKGVNPYLQSPNKNGKQKRPASANATSSTLRRIEIDTSFDKKDTAGTLLPTLTQVRIRSPPKGLVMLKADPVIYNNHQNDRVMYREGRVRGPSPTPGILRWPEVKSRPGSAIPTAKREKRKKSESAKSTKSTKKRGAKQKRTSDIEDLDNESGINAYFEDSTDMKEIEATLRLRAALMKITQGASRPSTTQQVNPSEVKPKVRPPSLAISAAKDALEKVDEHQRQRNNILWNTKLDANNKNNNNNDNDNRNANNSPNRPSTAEPIHSKERPGRHLHIKAEKELEQVQALKSPRGMVQVRDVMKQQPPVAAKGMPELQLEPPLTKDVADVSIKSSISAPVAVPKLDLNKKVTSVKNPTPRKKCIPKYEVDDRVEGNYRVSGQWYKGDITKVYVDDAGFPLYDITYDDDETEESIAEVNVRKIEKKPLAERMARYNNPTTLKKKHVVVSAPVPAPALAPVLAPTLAPALAPTLAPALAVVKDMQSYVSLNETSVVSSIVEDVSITEAAAKEKEAVEKALAALDADDAPDSRSPFGGPPGTGRPNPFGGPPGGNPFLNGIQNGANSLKKVVKKGPTEEEQTGLNKKKEEKKQADLLIRQNKWNIFKETVASCVPRKQKFSTFVELGIPEELSHSHILGKGKFAIVYKAHDRRGRPLVLKVAQFSGNNPQFVDGAERETVPPLKFIEEYEREIEVLTALKHENVLRFEGVLLPPAVPFGIVCEYMNGGSLGQAMLSKDNWNRNIVSEDQRMILLEDILRGLAYMHKEGFIHRDIKPYNILLCCDTCFLASKDRDEGRSPRAITYDDDENNPKNWIRAKIADFGTSVKLQPNEALFEEIGTTGYTAPDIFSGKYNNSVDIFSFSVVMWELFSNDRKNPMTGLRNDKITAENVRPILGPEHPSSVTVLTKKGWHEDPTKRPSLQAMCGLLHVKI